MKVLANDGIAPEGKKMLEEAGFEVSTETVEQDNLVKEINEKDYIALLVRSATKVRKELINQCPGLKFIGRGGVGMDNIDVEYARSKGITVTNTPAASSQSVAELVFAHLFSTARSLYDANRQMPSNGAEDFKKLKKKYSKGIELRNKTLGIIGFGRIGQSVAQYALGCGMKVIATDNSTAKATISLNIFNGGTVDVDIETTSIDEVLSESDFVSLHVPAQPDGSPVIGKNEISRMKDGAILINAARGGVVDETALMEALAQGKLAHAALDVFNNEPTPDKQVLAQDKISLSPHIGAATVEAQQRIGIELAEAIISEFEPVKQ